MSSSCCSCSCAVPSRLRAVLAWLLGGKSRQKYWCAKSSSPPSTLSHTPSEPPLPPAALHPRRSPPLSLLRPAMHTHCLPTPTLPLAAARSRFFFLAVVVIFCCNRMPPADYLKFHPNPQQARAAIARNHNLSRSTGLGGPGHREMPRRPWRVAHGVPPTPDLGQPPSVATQAAAGETVAAAAAATAAATATETIASETAAVTATAAATATQAQPPAPASAVAQVRAAGGDAGPAAAGSVAAARPSVLVPEAAEAAAAAEVAEAGTLPELQAEAEAVPTTLTSSWKERVAERAARAAVAKAAAASKVAATATADDAAAVEVVDAAAAGANTADAMNAADAAYAAGA